MRQWIWVPVVLALAAGACRQTANVEQERSALLQRDREWSQSVKDIDKFMSYYTADASMDPAGMPVANGPDAIRKTVMAMTATPDFSLQWTPSKAEISNS